MCDEFKNLTDEQLEIRIYEYQLYRNYHLSAAAEKEKAIDRFNAETARREEAKNIKLEDVVPGAEFKFLSARRRIGVWIYTDDCKPDLNLGTYKTAEDALDYMVSTGYEKV